MPPLGAEERLEALLAEFGALLRASVARVCRPGTGVAPEDVEQEARIRLWRALESERDITHPASYVVRVATTAAIDALRRVRARREEPLRTAGTIEDSGEIGPAQALRASGPSPEAAASTGETFRKVEVGPVRSRARPRPGRPAPSPGVLVRRDRPPPRVDRAARPESSLSRAQGPARPARAGRNRL